MTKKHEQNTQKDRATKTKSKICLSYVPTSHRDIVSAFDRVR